MALIAGEQATGGEVRDNDGRLIVVGPGGVAIAGGGGGTASTVALDAATLAALETISVANLLNPHPVSIATALDISDRTARLLGHVTVDNLPATQPVSGSVNVGNFPASQAVTGTFFQATQPVSGTVTANAGTGPWPVTDNGGSITVDAPVGTPVRVDPTGTTTQPVSLAAAVTIGAGAAQIGTVANVGDVDHDAVNTLKVVQTGGHASYPAIPAGVSADGDRVRQWQDRSGAQIIRKRPIPTYTAQYRLANASASARVLLTGALTANTNKQAATIYHTAASTKRVQVKYAAVNFHSSSVAGIIEWELVTLSATTAPATGNPAVTPGVHDQADAAADATCLTLPTTQGSVVNADRPIGDSYAVNLGATGAGSTLNPPPAANLVVLWDSRSDSDGKDPVMRAGVAEGYAIVVRANVASNIAFTATILFTEE